jgi:hypothetical protein
MYKQGNDIPAKDKIAKVQTVEAILKIKGRAAPHQSMAFIGKYDQERFRVQRDDRNQSIFLTF